MTSAEIKKLEELVRQHNILTLTEGLTTFDDKTNPNYKFLYDAITSQKFDFKGDLIEGVIGCILEGSSRSGKTWSGIDIIIWLCTEVEENCVINIVRETYNEFKTTVYLDFKQRLDDFGLPNPFHNAQEVKSFKIGKNQINFLGSDKIGKRHGAGSDYLFFNEMMHIPQGVFNQLVMRCKKFWWGDYNPSVTDHWVFNSVIPRNDVGFLRTTYKDNPFISGAERRQIESYEPWEPGSYQVEDNVVTYQGREIDEHHQPPPHPVNVDQGTADEFQWLVYGLGLRGAMTGVIFPKVHYIDEFPALGFHYGLDFGFTVDPTCLVKHAEDENNIYLELLLYQPVDNPQTLDLYLEKLGIDNTVPITADSQDKYTGENKGTVEMVRDLRDRGWSIEKVRKRKSVMFWLTSMKGKRICVVKNNLYKYAKREQENYRMREINGIAINQPIDQYNHFWDAARYAHMAWNASNYSVAW